MNEIIHKEAKCNRVNECKSFNNDIRCNGCGFQHFYNVFKDDEPSEDIKFLSEEYFKICSEKRRTVAGRYSLDGPTMKLFKNKFEGYKSLEWLNEIKVQIKIDKEEISLRPKFDGAFKVNGKYIFYEIKGYGDNTNDVLSAICAAQLLKASKEFENKEIRYYFIALSSSIENNGLTRKNFVDAGRKSLYPYVKWAEHKGYIWFYSFKEIESLFKDIKSFIKVD